MTSDPATLPRYLKFLTDDGRGPFSKFAWPIGEWVEIDGPLLMCKRGIHVTTIEQAPSWLNARCHPVEVRGEVIEGDTKVCVRAARLGPALTTWTKRTARLYAADCAERVLPIFERNRPDDDGPRKAIEATRAFARGEIDDAALAAALAAAWAAAWAAAGDAAGAAAGAAAGDAAWVAARASAQAAELAAAQADAQADAGDAERKWQSDHLARVLRGEIYQGVQ